MRFLRPCAAFCVFFLAHTITTSAWATKPTYTFDPFSDFKKIPVVVPVRERLAGHMELGAFFTGGLVSSYWRHLGASVFAQYHVFEFLSVELLAGYLDVKETNLINNPSSVQNGSVRSQLGQFRNPHLPGLIGMQWLSALNVQWSPVIAKFSFFSKFDVHWQGFLLAGAGVMGAVKYVAINAEDNLSAEVSVLTQLKKQSVHALFNIGAGVRVFFPKGFVFRFEVRDFIYFDSFKTSSQKTELIVVQQPMFLLGVSYIFDPLFFKRRSVQ